MVNKDVYPFIISCAHSQLVNSYSHEAQQLLQTIDSDTPIDVVFINFLEPGDILYQVGSSKILTYLDCMTGFGLGASTGLK